MLTFCLIKCLSVLNIQDRFHTHSTLLFKYLMYALWISFVSSLLKITHFFKKVYSFVCLLFTYYVRQLESEMETVVKILQPGPLGIIEHKFSAEEIHQANVTVSRGVENWQRNAKRDHGNEILKDYLHKWWIRFEGLYFGYSFYFFFRMIFFALCQHDIGFS